ncbi:MAG TPA: PsiF family protein [Burkholderiales bacterium]|nr:PsiF family protein [Burkholderiales bacterium]
MNKLIVALCAVALSVSAAYAQDKQGEKKELTEQQKKMQQCNADAKGKKFKDADERQAFMSACLKGEKHMTQQEKMTACNKEASAKAMKGDDRKAFMSKCLSG